MSKAATYYTFVGKYTNETIGTIETLFAQCICGILWGLFAAQPLLIMSATGPVLIFEASLYAVSLSTLNLLCEHSRYTMLVLRLHIPI